MTFGSYQQNWVPINVFTTLCGLTRRRVYHLIYSGQWVQGKQYNQMGKKCPIMVSIRGYEQWAGAVHV